MTTFAAPTSAPAVNDPLAATLKDLVRQAADHAPRSLQTSIGPSEIGDPCARRIAYKVMDTARVNYTDPWPSVVGTAVHAWLEDVFKNANPPGGPVEWLVEQRLPIEGNITGSCDLFHVPTRTVIDHKVVGKSSSQHYRRHGPRAGYITQAHLYGYGWTQLGFPVEQVAFAFWSRPGWLDDLWTWTAPYDEAIALAALERLALIKCTVVDLDVERHPDRWALIPGHPEGCRFCPYSRPGGPADGTGCPGPT
jgi:hypothetical protein